MNRALVSSALVALLAACGGGGELTSINGPRAEIGSAQRANQFTANDQQQPAVALNDQGDGVVVWESFGEDGSHFGVYARRYRNGQAQGDAFRVNTFTTGRQNAPDVAMDAAGNFVGGTIYGQRFAADGRPEGGEFQIGPGDSNFDSQGEPRVAMNADGAFVVTWSVREISRLAITLGRNDIEEAGIQARAYGADGRPRGTLINVFGPQARAAVRRPDVGIAADGRFAVSWIGSSEPLGIRVRTYSALGLPTSPATTVEAPTEAVAIDLPALVMLPDGRFVIGWEAYTFGYRPLGLFVRGFAAADVPLGPVQRVADPGVARLHERLALDALADGTVLVVGQGMDEVVLGGLRSDGSSLPSLVLGGSSASFPAVAVGATGALLTAWTAFGEDGSGRSVLVRHLRLGS
jgi:hypothetical protein